MNVVTVKYSFKQMLTSKFVFQMNNLPEGHSQGLKLPNYKAINNPAEQINTYIAEFLYEKTH